jgi:hypothetical protein
MKSNHYFGFERGTIATLEESESPRVAIAHVTRHSCEPVTVMMSELKRGQHIGDQLRDSEIPVPSQRQYKPGCAKSAHSNQQIPANTAWLTFSRRRIAEHASSGCIPDQNSPHSQAGCPCRLLMKGRRLRSCGLQRSKASSAKSTWRT